jgi:hypothetical protein
MMCAEPRGGSVPSMRGVIAVVLVVVLAGCAGRSGPPPRTPAKEPLVYVWRNFEFTGIPEEMTVYEDGEVRYRNLLHTQARIKVVSGRMGAGALSDLRRQLARVDLDRAKATGDKPRRSGFRYIVRSQGHAGTAAEGHLRGRMGGLVRTLAAEMNRLQGGSLSVQR